MTWTVNDTRQDLTGTLTSDAGPVNILGATLALHIRRPDGTTLTTVGNVANPSAGTWSYRWQTGDLNVAGAWQVEVQVTYTDGGIQTFGPSRFYVQPELG